MNNKAFSAGLSILVAATVGFVSGSLGSVAAQNSPGGVFRTSENYTVGGQWTWRGNASPWIIEGATDDPFETTITFGEPTADRIWTFSDVTDTVVGLAATQTLSNKTVASPVFSGSVTGTYTLAGTPTLTAPTINSAIITPALTAAGSAVTLTAAANAGHRIALDTAAGSTVTLPAATGSGVCFAFVVTVTPTSNQHRIAVVGNDEFVGSAILSQDGGDTLVMFEAADGSDNDHLNMNSGTQGGEVGDQAVVCDVLADNWSISYQGQGSGAEVTPFNTGQVS